MNVLALMKKSIFLSFFIKITEKVLGFPFYRCKEQTFYFPLTDNCTQNITSFVANEKITTHIDINTDLET